MGLFTFFKSKQQKLTLPQRSIDDIKGLTKILFIDDVKFDVVDNLIKSGWIHTKRIKDVDTLNQPEVKDSHIYFVDIEGVGKKLGFTDEGLGLSRALKETYPSKAVILYSAQREGDRFDKTLSIVDSTIRKNADSYEFIKLAEKFSKQAFSYDQIFIRIQKIIKEETGQAFELSEIELKIISASKKDGLNLKKLSESFEVSTKVAEFIGTVIKVFLES